MNETTSPKVAVVNTGTNVLSTISPVGGDAAGGIAIASVPGGCSGAHCVGDCNGDGKVTCDEVITVAAIVLGDQLVTACSAGVVGNTVGIDQVVKARGNEICGCIPRATSK